MSPRKQLEFLLLFCIVLPSTRLVSIHGQNAPVDPQKPEAVLQVGHRRAVRAVVFSPDGRWLASGAKDNTIKIWDVATGRVLRTLYGHGAAVNALAVSPDGHTLASGSGNTYDVRYAKLFFQGGQIGGHEVANLRLWDIRSGRQLLALRGHELAVMALAFSRDGHSLTSASSEAIKVWDVPSGNQISSQPAFPLPRISGLKEGFSLSSMFGTHVIGENIWKAIFKDSASGADISPTGDMVAMAPPGKRIQLFDPAQQRRLPALELDAKPGTSNPLAFSPDGQTLAHISNGTAIVLRRAANAAQLWRSILPGQVALIRFTPDGKSLLAETSGAQSRSLLWLAASDGHELRRVDIGDQRTSRLVAFSPDARIMAMVAKGDHAIELRDAGTGHLLRTLQPAAADTSQETKPATDAALRQQLVELGLTQPGELNEAEEDVGEFSRAYRAGEAITFTADGKWLLAKQGRLADLTTALWDSATGMRLQDSQAVQFREIGNPFRSPDGRFEVVPRYTAEAKKKQNAFNPFSSLDNPYSVRVKLLDTHSGHQIHTLDAGTTIKLDLVATTGFSLDSSRIAVSGFKARVKGLFTQGVHVDIYLYETASGHKIGQFDTPAEDEETGSPTSQILSAHDYNKSMEAYHAIAVPTALAISRDGGTVAAGYRRKISLFDSTTAKLLLSIPHAGGIGALSFNPDGRLLAALGKDGDAYLFDAHSGQLLATLVSVGSGAGVENDWLVVAPDGKFDGSPGGWNQILWRFAGDTFNVAPVETFFNEFYYPGLLAEILAGKKLRETRDFAQLDRRQPTLQVEVIGPSAGTINSRTIPVQVHVAEAPADKDHAEGSGVRDVRLFRNGSLVNAWRGDVHLDTNGKALLETTIPIVAGPNRLTAYAFNHDNIKSPDASLVVTGSPSLKRAGMAYVLTVGIDKYSNPDYNLKFAVADAEDMSKELTAQQRKVGTAAKIVVIPLFDSEATRENILLALKRLAGSDAAIPAGAPDVLNRLQPAQPEDEVFIYFAGHGAAAGQRFYLIPHDLGYMGSRTQLNQAGWQSIADHSISDLDLEEALASLDARDLLLVIDACNSGQALEAEERRRGPMNSKGLAQLAYEKGMYVLTAAQGYQAALEVKELGHGLLTYALVEEGLKTAAADRSPKDGKVVAREWMDYATMRVPELQEAQIEAAQKQGRVISFVEGEQDMRGQLSSRGLQRPRVFYRREPDPDPIVVARP